MIGGSGNGEAVAGRPRCQGYGRRWPGPPTAAQLGRLRNDANVISLGARMVSEDDAEMGLRRTRSSATAFSGEPRHQRRIDLLSAYEETGESPADRV